MSTPTYTKVKEYAQILAEGKTIKDRREAGKTLGQSLNDAGVRRRLAAEARWRPEGLREMWRLLVSHVVIGLDNFHRKNKLVEEDVRVLKRVLEACLCANEGFENEPSTSKLTKREVRSIIQFVIDVLNETDEGGLHPTELELTALEVLSLVCGAREFVVHFRPDNDMRVIFEIVEGRIEEEMSVFAMLAAQIAHRLIETSISMQISLDSLLPGYVNVVASWCRAKYSMSETSLGELEHLIGGLANLLSSSPEAAIGPMTRHGATIFKFAKRRYGRPASRQNSRDRDSLNRYFLAHIHVCQVAGRLQGLHSGDLGDLGPATLTYGELSSLLAQAVHFCTVDEIKDTNKSTKNNKTDFPLSKRTHKMQLQTTVRLLSCAQRLFIADAEWHGHIFDKAESQTSETPVEDQKPDSPVDHLLATLRDSKHPDKEYLDLITPEIKGKSNHVHFAESPFCENVLKRLNAASATWRSSMSEDESPYHQMDDLLPLLSRLNCSTSDSGSINENSVIPLLQIICSAVEIFPAGDCWVSSCSMNSWQRLPAVVEQSLSPLTLLTGSSDGLASIVQIIGDILETQGKPGGSEYVQKWALATLVKLSEAASMKIYLSRGDTDGLSTLLTTWERIWSIIFRPEVRYGNATRVHKEKDGSPTVGWLVLALLEGVFRMFSLFWSQSIEDKQSSFLYQQQESIWNLPVFSNPRAEIAAVCFELLYAVVYTVGLVEGFNDAINQSVTDTDGVGLRTGRRRTRRERLVEFCLRATDTSHLDESCFPAVGACMALLVHGNTSSRSTTDSFKASLLQVSAVSFRNKSCLLVSDFETRSTGHRDDSPNVFLSLWKSSPITNILRGEACVSVMDEITSDFAIAKQAVLRHSMVSSIEAIKSSDFVSKQRSNQLMSVTISRLCNVLHTESVRRSVLGEGHTVICSADVHLTEWLVTAKILLTVALTCPDRRSVLQFEKVASSFAPLISMIEAGLPSLIQDESGFLSVFLKLWQMTSGIIDFAAVSACSLPKAIKHVIEPLYNIVCDLVTRHEDLFSSVSAGSFIEANGLGSPPKAEFLGLDNEHAIDIEISNAKRRFVADDTSKAPQKRHRAINIGRQTTTYVLPGHQALYLSSLLLLTLSPCLESCEKVCKVLLQTKELSSIGNFESDVNGLGGVVACHLLCVNRFFLHETAVKEILKLHEQKAGLDSIVTLLCNTVNKTRSVLSADSIYFPFGYDICAKIVEFADSSRCSTSITTNEAKEIIRLLNDLEDGSTRKHFGVRPLMRALRLRAAIGCFLSGQQAFHEEVDKLFPGTFVLPSLSDVSGLVRRQASVAVAAALRMMGNQEKVTGSVRKFIPPLTIDPLKADEEYKSWYQAKNGPENLDLNRAQFWEDTRLSVESDALRYLSSIAENVSDTEICQSVIFELIEISCRRPDMQMRCYMWLDRIAFGLGFEGAESIMESLAEDLLHDWIQLRAYKLLDIPIMLAAPILLHYCLNAGRILSSTQNATASGLDDRLVDDAQIQCEVVQAFILRWQRSIIPQVMAKSVSAAHKGPEEKDSVDLLFKNPYIREFCSVYDHVFSKDLVSLILRKRMFDTIAFQMSLATGNDFEQRISVQVAALLKQLLSDNVYLEGRQHASPVLRRYLEIIGCPTKGLSDQKTFQSFIESSGEEKDAIIAQMGSNIIELLLFSVYRLSLSHASLHLRHRIKAVEFVCDFIVDDLIRCNGSRCVNLSFCVQCLSNLLLDQEFSLVHDVIISALERIVKLSIRKCKGYPAVAAEMKQIMMALLPACMYLHELCQSAVIRECRESSKTDDAVYRQSLGLYRPMTLIQGDSWGWTESSAASSSEQHRLQNALARYMLLCDPACLNKLRGTFEIIKLVIDSQTEESGLCLEADDLIGAAPPYTIPSSHFEALGQIDPSYSAQRVVLDFLESRKIDSLKCMKSSLFKESGAFGMYDLKVRLSPIGQRLLSAQLARLVDILIENKNDPGNLYDLVDERLVRELTSYCSALYPAAIRQAAGRCLGYIPIDQVLKRKHDPETCLTETWTSVSSVDKFEIDRCIKARCFEATILQLRSADYRSAMVGLDTLKVLRVHDQSSYKNYFQDPKCLSILQSLPSDERSASFKTLTMTTQEHKILLDTARRLAGQRDLGRDAEWCWNPQLWKCSSSVGYEDWICCIVSSIIVCCYPQHTKRCSSSPFFTALLRLSAMDPKVSESVFPALVLDLLKKREPDAHSNGSPVEKDTWIGNPDGHYNLVISESFASVFESVNESARSASSCDNAMIELLLNTIDSLRRLTLQRFMNAKTHSRNRSKKSSDGGASASHPTCWTGVPFGTVLRLDGLLIVSACMRVNRLISAMFYAEMYADSRLGGPQRALLLVSPGESATPVKFISTSDISGFGTAAGGNKTLSQSTVASTNEVIQYLTLLKECMVGLSEHDNAKAFSRLRTDLLLRQAHTLPLMELSSDVRNNPLEQLQYMDSHISQSGGKGPSILATVQYLEQLRLPSVAQVFIRGVMPSHNIILSEPEASKLRDKWFESSLNRMSWDGLLINQSLETDIVSSIADRDEGNLPAQRMGFYEAIAKMIGSLSIGDVEQSRALLQWSRNLVLARLPAIFDGEAQLEKLWCSLDRLRSLNITDMILDAMEDPEACLEVFESQPKSQRSLLNNETMTFRGRFSESMTELLLRALYTHESSKGNDETTKKVCKRLTQHMWLNCAMDTYHGDHEAAVSTLQRLFEISTACPAAACDTVKLRLQECHILEAKGDFTGAIRHIRQVIEVLRDQRPSHDYLLGEALVTCGRWMAKYKTEPGSSILKNFLESGNDIARREYEKGKNEAIAGNMTASLLALGHLASDLFEAVRDRMSSSEWRDQDQILSYQEKELEECDALLKVAESSLKANQSMKVKAAIENDINNNKIYKAKLRREVDRIKDERHSISKSKEHYRIAAIRSISSALQIVSLKDPVHISKYVCMLFGLWFSPGADPEADNIQAVIIELEQVPSFRFVPLSSQFMSRIGCEDTYFHLKSYEEPLRKLILKMCCEHPYHCLQHIVYLSHSVSETGNAKIAAAKYFREALRKNKRVFRLLSNYELVVRAYMHLAKTPIDKSRNLRGTKISFSKIGKHADRLDACLEGVAMEDRPCILTKPPRLRPLSDYGDLREDPTADLILGFEREFAIADGGMNLPKIVNCVGTRQGRYKQLVKDKDEIRQDAVMQQLFGYINELLGRREEVPNSRGAAGDISSLIKYLKVITYNIVPLGPLCGVLEWVENTMAFNDFIVDSVKDKLAGAHSRYYPGEWSSQTCRVFLEKEMEDKRKAFEQIYRHHSPCFRYFFVEKFGHLLEEWYAAKQKYARSTAVNSVVGHILGIGDRHSSNILIHKKTAELVHIDFGIVFEQGKLLRTPERVPFRLTQNMVDGLSPAGVEGIFTKTAETTMRVLKHNSSALLTILTSIAADPLYIWAMSPVKARARQVAVANGDQDGYDEFDGEASESGDIKNLVDVLKRKHNKEDVPSATDYAKRNDQASHVIAKVQQKLQGYEDGTSGEQQEVEGQIQFLINQAQSIDNLALMYPGWAPWL